MGGCHNLFFLTVFSGYLKHITQEKLITIHFALSYMDKDTFLIGEEQIRSNVNFSELISDIENCYADHYLQRSKMPSRTHVEINEYNGEIVSMPSKLSDNSVGVKWASDYPKNTGLPTIMGVVIYNDKMTGKPLAIMNGTEITKMRTGCAAAIGMKHLAPRNITSVGMIGLGVQAYDVLRAKSSVYNFEKLYVSDISDISYAAFVEEFNDDYQIIRCSIEECISNSDVVSTITPTTDPIVNSMSSGLHVNAMGADAHDKQEITSRIQTSEDVVLVTDDVQQSEDSGEFSKILRSDSVNEIYTIGEVIHKDLSKELRNKKTIFDSTGLSLQDIATARRIYQDVDKESCQKFRFV